MEYQFKLIYNNFCEPELHPLHWTSKHNRRRRRQVSSSSHGLDNHVLGKRPIQSDTYMPCKIGTVLLVGFVAETIGAMAASVPW